MNGINDSSSILSSTMSTSLGFDTVGNVTSATDPLGNSVSNTFSGQNSKTSTQTAGTQTFTRKFDYAANGNLLSSTSPSACPISSIRLCRRFSRGGVIMRVSNSAAAEPASGTDESPALAIARTIGDSTIGPGRPGRLLSPGSH